MQSGTTTSSGNGTTTVTISAVDTTRSFLVFNTRHNSNRPVGSQLRGRLASATTLEFVRVTDETSTMTIRWYVAEFGGGVNVQRGEITSMSSTTNNVTLSPALSAVSRAFVTWSKTPGSADQASGPDDFILGELTSTTNLQFRVSTAPAAHTIWWQVVEFSDATVISVQKGTVALSGATLSATSTLGTAVNLAKTFLLTGYRVTGDGADIGARMLSAQLTNTTTVSIQRSIAGPVVARANTWTTGTTHATVAGNNRLLVFAVGYENATDIGVSSVTWGGQAMTRIPGDVAGTTTVNRVELWYLKESGIAAASGSTFAVTWGGTAPTDALYAAATYQEVDQTTPISASSSNSTAAATPNPLTTSASVSNRSLTVSAAICGNPGSYTWGSWTEGTDQQSGSTTTMSTAEHAVSADGTDTASATHSSANRQAIVAAVLNRQLGEDTPEAAWQAVEMKDGSTVQSGVASFGVGVAQQTASLTTIRTSHTIAFASVQPSAGQSMGRSPYEGDDVTGVCNVTLSLSSTQLTLDRDNTASTCDVAWYVVEFAARRVRIVDRRDRTDLAERVSGVP